MSASRFRLKEDVDKAYTVQTRSAIEGGIRGTAIGVGLTIITHYSWPFFRRQTFQFKGFLVCTCTRILVIAAFDYFIQGKPRHCLRCGHWRRTSPATVRSSATTGGE
ncbi:hypothetical protein C8F04DRAFT_12414 [Mycena alexandri]|uniref:Uncharacterized protein n=1 Tax=Mycena alexandri TaxID=1745969 RepID=A0AAD6TJK5_9AGAR|nr:hypothetical protein C8F04DRAFT_12414 [Mycena alexandri]